MDADTVIVRGEFGNWGTTESDTDSQLVFSDPRKLHYVPRAVWLRWLAANAEYKAAIKALEETPTVQVSQLRRAILDGYGRD